MAKEDVLVRAYLCEPPPAPKAKPPEAAAAAAEAPAAAAAVAEAPAAAAKGCDALATKVKPAHCCEVVVPESLRISELKKRLHAALSELPAEGSRGGAQSSGAAAGTGGAAATLQKAQAAGALRLFKRSGARPGGLLRDSRTLRQAMTGGFDDKEVAVQELSHEEKLSDDALLIRWQLIASGSSADGKLDSSGGKSGGEAPSATAQSDRALAPPPLPTDATPAPASAAPAAAPPPTPPPPPAGPSSVFVRRGGTLCAQSSWSTAQLLDELSACSGVDRARLSMAKPPTVGSKALTTALVNSLKWDDQKVLQCPKIGAYPMQLRDADVLLVRDADTVDASAAAAKPVPKGPKKGGKLPAHTVVGGGTGQRRESGLSIHTFHDQTPATPSGGGEAAAAN